MALIELSRDSHMLYWETAHTAADQPAVVRNFTELCQAAHKVVYSKTLEAVASARPGSSETSMSTR